MAIAFAGLGGCGGGDEQDADSAQAAALATAEAGPVAPAAVDATARVRPMFHALPVLLPEPAPAGEVSAQALGGPQQIVLDGVDSRIDTKRLTPSRFEARRAEVRAAAASGIVRPADTTVATVYDPDEIRRAYRLPKLASADAAAKGAGQTIYIVVAGRHSTAFADLNVFARRFGLPGCSGGSTVAPGTRLPLAAASATGGCSLLVANVDASGQLLSQVPTGDDEWGMETALDLQWAHAMAPMARLVLIQAASETLADMLPAVELANRMGAGVVSMSWGAEEASWATSLQSSFKGRGMNYVAAVGDDGTQSLWPAVTPEVLAVGGTTLSYDGVNPRRENVWSGSGGGTSLYFSRPSYQLAVKTQGSALGGRGTADVSFNADPYTGHQVYHEGQWLALGGTSAGTPQWAGILAVANAQRQRRGWGALSTTHISLYGLMGSPSFSDITSGANGSCRGCTAAVGYDHPSGIGTPNVDVLLTRLVPATAPNRPPVFGSLKATGRVKSALSFTVPVSDPDGDAITLGVEGALPKGMSFNAASRSFSWPKPAAGSHSVALTALDAKGNKARGTVVFSIGQANRKPSLPSASWSAFAGRPFEATVAGTDPDGDALSYTLTKAPAGMSISADGVVRWARPTIGKFTVSVKASDAYGASVSKKIKLKVVAPPSAPVVDGAAMSATAGKKWSFKVSARDANGDKLRFTVSGAPAGLSIDSKGKLAWKKPLAGTHAFTVTASDPGGLTGTARMTLTVR
ncbi:S53 family peptidase [Rubrivivax gelatinosus]|uniref:S53 family peptidase n=1 Tax=Rubrivivax gelatinosus TaxID=28068 RepID=UPI00104723A6|nr:S53 family peptidase [Rubrivivax gelatinosus]